MEEDRRAVPIQGSTVVAALAGALLSATVAVLIVAVTGRTPSRPVQHGGSGWSASASGLGNPGDRFAFDCPAGGSASSVWGDRVYTGDSSVCTAAVLEGLIGFTNGGRVTVEIDAGRSSYVGATRNGVTSSSYGSWRESFVFAGSTSWLSSLFASTPPPPPPTPTPTPFVYVPPRFTSTPAPRVGDQRSVDCQTSTWGGSVWGTDTYTADSDVCQAAIHAGVLAPGATGRVTIEYAPGEASYAGTTRHGIESRSWSRYGTSFVFVGSSKVKATLPALFRDAGIEGALDHTLVSPGPVVWELSLFRDGTALISQRRERRQLTLTGKATPLASGKGEARIAVSGTLHRYEPSGLETAPIDAILVLRASDRGFAAAEESRTLGLGGDGIDLTPDDQ